ncbi:MAG: hypothetical protein EXS36_05680 [Pedosphaera sp.]|nr:hypothetical protein [Pedosphaera sp.]
MPARWVRRVNFLKIDPEFAPAILMTFPPRYPFAGALTLLLILTRLATGLIWADPDILKTDLLGVFAHPDDETSAAATFARLALGEHKTVSMVYCTRGDGGGNMAGTQAGRGLAILRAAELNRCLRVLGVSQNYCLERPDFGYTENLAISLEKWGHEETLSWLVRYVRVLRPEVIVTWNPAPIPGQHGHHQAAGWLAVEAFTASADPNRFPEQLTHEGLSTWQPRKLYFPDRLGTTQIDLSQPLPDGRLPGGIAGEALANHRSQGFGEMASAPWLRHMTNQVFRLVQTVVPWSPVETDLFLGLPLVGERQSLLPPLNRENKSAVSVRFLSRPAFERYREFLQSNHLASEVEPLNCDIPILAGRPSDIRLEMLNSTTNGFNSTLEFSGPMGWKIEPARMSVRFSANRTNILTVDVTAPLTAANQTGEIRVRASGTSLEMSPSLKLYVTPRMRAPRIRESLQLNSDPSDRSWTTLPIEIVPSTNVWQGEVVSSQDCSATFRLGHDNTSLFVEVLVTDDVVVSNIAPNDIKGHWRTDSVELCFDPQNGAEHTFGCYKLGIIPFDTTGQLGATRDADAEPGPIRTTAPGTRAISWRTSDGYGIRASIPFTELGVHPSESKRLGFNLLIYDGDKRTAAVGENINKARLGWTSRPGIQGRPEDWGRLILE